MRTVTTRLFRSSCRLLQSLLNSFHGSLHTPPKCFAGQMKRNRSHDFAFENDTASVFADGLQIQIIADAAYRLAADRSSFKASSTSISPDPAATALFVTS